MSKRKLSPDVEALIAAEYADGTSATALAARYGVDPVTILKAVRNAGGRVRSAGQHNTGHPYEAEITCTDTRPHGAIHVPELDYRSSRAERTAASLKSYFEKEGRR